MEIVAITLAVMGGIMSFIGGIWFLIETFRASIWWGLGCLLLPIVSFIFLVTHWHAVSKPFGISILGSVLVFVATLLAPGILAD